MDEHIIVGLINSLSGALFILLSIPLLKRKIKMNDWYGFRLIKAFESEQKWYDINEYGARIMLKWSLFLFFSGILAFFIKFDDHSFLPGLWVGIPVICSTAIPIVQTIIYSKKL